MANKITMVMLPLGCVQEVLALISPDITMLDSGGAKVSVSWAVQREALITAT
ncbi:MAG: hypothetical protein IPP37_08280 [Saprospiraceae bacterium]|nr:hypothetical protein [Saprospiraceae bacterium]